ncbi:MAG: O-antigen ligase family protein [bacterium]|nr:O-antigen ligase family protein [bacterium]
MDFILGDKNKTLKILFLSIVLAVIIGFLIGILSPLYGIFVIAFLAFLTLTLSNLRFGIIFWIVTGGVFAVPIYSVRNAAIYPSITILSLLLFIWIILSLEKGTFGINRSSLFWPLTFLLIITILSSLKGVILYDPDVHGEHRFILVQILASILIIFSILTAFMIERFFITKEQIYLVYCAVIAIGIELTISAYFNLEKFGISQGGWFPMVQAHALSLAFASLIFIPELSLLKKIGFVILIIFSCEFVFWQFFRAGAGQWIAGWIAMGIPLIYILFQKSKKWGIYLLVLFLVLFFILAASKIEDVFSLAESERDYDRFIMWGFAYKLWLKNPFFGIGPGNYMDYALTYSTEGFKYTAAHSQYFQILSEVGGLGFICFCWVIVKISLLGRYLIHSVKDNFIKVFTVGIMGSIYGQLCAGVFADYILPSYHNGGLKNFCSTVYFWVLVGSLLAIEKIVKKEEKLAQGCRT